MSSSQHILIVDDDAEIRDLLAHFLSRHGFSTSTAADGQAMRKVMQSESIDLLVLDLMLPGEDGLSLCRSLRKQDSPPIIMLTAMGEDNDRIIGLEVGADDYISKPFNPRELLARIRAVLRRAGDGGQRPSASKTLTFEGWELDLGRRELRRENGTLVTLTSGEFDLLLALAERSQEILSRDFLLDRTKGRDANPMDRSIDVQLSRLRRKIERDPSNPEIIKTVRGGGYRFCLPVSAR
jgi:two-component system OmpR family response regulator